MAICHFPTVNIYLRNLKLFGFLATASSPWSFAVRIIDLSKYYSLFTMPHNRLARKKGQPVTNCVIATLGNSPKMRHDVASWNIFLAQPVMFVCHFCWRC